MAKKQEYVAKSINQIIKWGKAIVKQVKENTNSEEATLLENTVETYIQQVKMLRALEEEIKEQGPIVTKTYVKGRENIYINPAIREHTNLVNSNNRTVETLQKLYRSLMPEKTDGDEADPLLEALKGDDPADGEK